MAAEVELDIASGVPNPRWQLSSAIEQELRKRLAALQPVGRLPQAAAPLGYRGIVVRALEGTVSGTGTGDAYVSELRVFGGLVSIDVRDGSQITLEDPVHSLEVWLLDTAEDVVSAEMLEWARSEVHQGDPRGARLGVEQ